MTIELPEEKRHKIKQTILKLKSSKSCKIRFLAHVAGLLMSACLAVKYGKLYTKLIEREKFLALMANKNNYDASWNISNNIKTELGWWEDNILTCFNDINNVQTFDLEIFTDASKTGWGATYGTINTSGWWSKDELNLHINILELKAVYFALKCFTKNMYSKNILLRVDNTTAVSCINKMGSIQYPKLNLISQKIWKWCEVRNLWVFASYIPSEENIADKHSRRVSIETEWELSKDAYDKIVKKFGMPTIDLFASRTNTKCTRYFSWLKDPNSEMVDAFTVCWTDLKFYAFPPFALILRTLNKIIADRAEGIMVVPDWHSQPWYPVFKGLLVNEPLTFLPCPNLLSSPFRAQHPMTLTLVAGLLSARHL